MRRLISLLRGKCPKCEKGNVFHSKGNIFLLRMPKMNETCSNCSHRFMIETGYFFGAMYVSYGLTIIEAILLFLILINFTVSANMLVLSIAIFMILMSFINYKFSRLIWMYIFTKKQ